MASGRQHERALSLIEVIVILAVLVILVALLVPSTVQILTGARRDITLDEMENLKKAMIGDPNLKTSGVRSSFGYLGDMGNLPLTLDNLVTSQTPAYAFNSSKGVGAGWRGPYITLGPGSDAASHRVDAFGIDYTYSITNFTNAQGQAVDAKLVSWGQDGLGGGTGVDEDVTLETLVAETTATVTGYAFGLDGNPLNVATVTMNYPANGTLTSSSPTATDSAGFYQFTNIPFGIRSVSFNPGLLYIPGSARTGSATNNVEFRVANFSTSAITVGAFVADFTPAGGTGFLRSNILWNGTQVWSCTSNNPMGSGEQVSFNPDPIVAADANPTPPQRVAVDASNVQVPDVKVVGSGTEVRIELVSFRQAPDTSCTAGTARVMSGASFNVTLKDPSNNIVSNVVFTVP